MEILYHPIGTIHSPYRDISGMPIQPSGATGVRGWIEILDDYTPGLRDLDGFSHIFLIYHLHRAGGFQPVVTPFLDSKPHGVFSTRAPRRPNPVGLSVVRLLGIEGNRLDIEDVDILDGTPLLDIKPFVPEFDQPEAARIGWLEGNRGRARHKRSDDRFN